LGRKRVSQFPRFLEESACVGLLAPEERASLPSEVSVFPVMSGALQSFYFTQKFTNRPDMSLIRDNMGQIRNEK
jgi:hypothetical protein